MNYSGDEVEGETSQNIPIWVAYIQMVQRHQYNTTLHFIFPVDLLAVVEVEQGDAAKAVEASLKLNWHVDTIEVYHTTRGYVISGSIGRYGGISRNKHIV